MLFYQLATPDAGPCPVTVRRPYFEIKILYLLAFLFSWYLNSRTSAPDSLTRRSRRKGVLDMTANRIKSEVPASKKRAALRPFVARRSRGAAGATRLRSTIVLIAIAVTIVIVAIASSG